MTFIAKLSKSPRVFNGISWGVTALIVLSLLGYTLWHILPPTVVAAPEPTPTRQEALTDLPAATVTDNEGQAIVRHVSMKTDLSSRPNYDVVEYTVRRGDSIFSIAKAHQIKPETLLWANYDLLQDSPDSIRVGQVLKIPPVDGVYYQWKEGDTVDAIAKEFSATSEDILNYPGNKFDLTNPDIKSGTYVMVPGGKREFVQWIIPTIARGSSGTSSVGQAACSGGPQGGAAFVWPAPNHYLSGNEFWSGHLGIDIAAVTGTPIFAAGTGVVTLAATGWNHGYGNVIMIDHGYDTFGNHWLTLYGHLSQINVSVCQAVYAGNTIGLAGDTGNAFGAHLHFEVRENGGFVNPWTVLPPP